jgi:hypothetical protein
MLFWPQGPFVQFAGLEDLYPPQVAAAGMGTRTGPPWGASSRSLREVNAFANGVILFGGTEPSSVHAADRRNAALDLLRAELDRSPSSPRFVLRADRRVSWSDIATTVDRLGASEEGWTFSVVVERRDVLEGRVDVTLGGRSGDAPAAASIDVVRSETDARARVRVGDASWVFPARSRPTGSALDAANAAWDGVLEAMRRSPASSPLRLAIADDAPWSHVAQVLGLAMVAGLARVDVVGWRTLALSVPFPEPPAGYLTDGATIDDRHPWDWPLWACVALGVAAAALVVGWTSRRSTRPRQTRTR